MAPRTYDLVKTRNAITAQLRTVRTVVEALDDGQFALPTRLGAWTVRELTAHIALGVGAVNRLLELPAPPVREITAVQWASGTAALAGRVDESTRTAAAETDPLALIDRVADRFAELTAVAAPDRLVAGGVGGMRLDDLLATRCVELVTHTDDLAAALNTKIPYDRWALATATRLLADTLAAKAPGGSVEVRIPPFAVVQCVAGPKHTRGTPPNVVETDPLTWIRLATGRLAWSAALDEASVTASGERADIADQLPLLS